MSNRRSCSTWRLYAIVDRAALGPRDPVDTALAAARGGADVIQLRDKSGTARWLLETAAALLPRLRPLGAALMINDRVDVVQLVGADGVHLGQEDLPVAQARELLGPERLIGKSTHSLEQALSAASEPVDYLALGPLFATPTKPDYGSVGLELIGNVVGRVNRPVVCIGGIEEGNVQAVQQAGGRCVAVIRAICAAADPEQAARELKRSLTQSHRGTHQTTV